MKRSRQLAPDLLEQVGRDPGEVCEHVKASLAQLASGPSLWPLDQAHRWYSDVNRVLAFARRWDSPTRAAGWNDVSLYGLHRRAPYANLAAMGAAFVIAIGRSTVLDVHADAIAIATPTGSRLRIFRRAPDPDAMPAWSLLSP